MDPTLHQGHGIQSQGHDGTWPYAVAMILDGSQGDSGLGLRPSIILLCQLRLWKSMQLMPVAPAAVIEHDSDCR